MTLFLGIDGGGTGCRAAVADGAGHILARAEAGPANIASDLTGAARNILAAAAQAARDAGARLEDMVAGLGLAGANAAGAPAALGAHLPFARLRIVTDGVTAVMGALGEADGIVAALGTGSVFGVQRGSAVRQIGGRGLALGDEGSGAWIGRAILSRALRAVDGLAPMTPLLAELVEEMGGDDRVVAFSLTARPADYAALAPRILISDDPAAQAVMAAAEADVAQAIGALQQTPALPVVFLGGLGPAFAARLAGRWPQRTAQGTALDGALLLARRAA
jgi:glucosamine kinase